MLTNNKIANLTVRAHAPPLRPLGRPASLRSAGCSSCCRAARWRGITNACALHFRSAGPGAPPNAAQAEVPQLDRQPRDQAAQLPVRRAAVGGVWGSWPSRPGAGCADRCLPRCARRLFVISRCKGLKVLDFRKIKLAEREEAERAFGGGVPAPAAAATFEPDEELAQAQAAVAEPEAQAIRKGPSAEQMTVRRPQRGPGAAVARLHAGCVGRPLTAFPCPPPQAIKAAIANASTLEEVRRLEDALKTGHLPSEVQVGEGGNGTAAMEEG